MLTGTVGASDIYLQVGTYGINHLGESASQSTIVLGLAGDPPLVGPSGRLKNSATPEASILVSASAGPTADFNADGLVGGADFLSWQRGFGVVSGAKRRHQGDANRDGRVDALDLPFWASSLTGPSVATSDFDGDEDRDGFDFLAWQRGQGIDSLAAHSQGDANGDGRVDVQDLAVWCEQFAAAAVPLDSALATAVPESGGPLAALGLIGLTWAVGFRARRGHRAQTLDRRSFKRRLPRRAIGRWATLLLCAAGTCWQGLTVRGAVARQ